MYNNYGKSRNRDHRTRGEPPYNGKGPMHRGRGGPGGGGGDFHRGPPMGPAPGMAPRYGQQPQPRMSRTPPTMVDVACFLTHKKYQDDRDMVIRKGQDAGVGVVVVPSLNVGGAISASKLASRYPGRVFFTAGIHPHCAEQMRDDSLSTIEDLLQKPECVGMGEIGLDYNRNFSPKDKQKEVFEKQLEMACKYNKPILLHERDAYTDFMGIIVKYQSRLPPVVIHCFTGTREQALVYVAMGFYIGITGYLIREEEDAGVKSLLYADDIPLDKILVETDGPFMFPQPEKAIFKPGIVERVSPQAQQSWDMCEGNRNEPCTLPLLVELVAGCMQRPARQVIEETTRNAVCFFSLHKYANLNLDIK